jgi:hypothetical protein
MKKAHVLEQVYATITFYLHKQRDIDRYLERWRAYTEAAWQEQQRKPPEFVQELRERLRRKREALVTDAGEYVDRLLYIKQ